jgi:hypothetical protein
MHELVTHRIIVIIGCATGTGWASGKNDYHANDEIPQHYEWSSLCARCNAPA